MTAIDANQPSAKARNSLMFIKEVAKYFMDFLETDFHKRKNPKRAIKLRNDDNLLLGLNLKKYPAFNKNVWKVINHGFGVHQHNSIPQGGYTRGIPKNLLDVINLQLDRVGEGQLEKLRDLMGLEIQKAATLFKLEFDLALNASQEGASKIIKDELVLPFIENLRRPLEILHQADENNLYLMEEELTSILARLMENRTSEVLKLLLSQGTPDVSFELRSVFNLTDVKNNIQAFFDDFRVTDLFLELCEIERNRSILDKQEFYLYFCDITYNKAKYPIFYIPFTLHKHDHDVDLEYDSQVYINKRALEYVVQEYNNEKGTKGNLKTISERIIYLSQHKDDFRNLLSGIMSEIENIFALDKTIDLNNPEPQTSRSLWTSVSNACHICIFDKSDEALVNDYEEILTLISSPENPLGEAFNRLIDDFVHREPVRFKLEVAEEWDSMSPSDRLVYPSPIPLNSEQRQIVTAVKKNDCRYITVEGPPGTGKSHTITAIVFDAILKNQSVLVLSDKKEALDVVEDKITETLNKVRNDRHFQNPILRLGKTGSTYNQILSTSSLVNIEAHYMAVKKEYESLEQNIQGLTNGLKEDIEAEIIACEKIAVPEIQELCALELHYESHESIVDVDEAFQQSQGAMEVEEFRRIFRKLNDAFISHEGGPPQAAPLLKLFQVSIDDFKDLAHVSSFLYSLRLLTTIVDTLKSTLGEKIKCFLWFGEFSGKGASQLRGLVERYERAHLWLVGYLFSRKKIKSLDAEFKNAFPHTKYGFPHERLEDLKGALDVINCAMNPNPQTYSEWLAKSDYLHVIHRIVGDERLLNGVREIGGLLDDVKYLIEKLPKYPRTMSAAGINPAQLKSLCENRLTQVREDEFDRLIRYVTLKQKVANDFVGVPTIEFANHTKQIESLVTAQMTLLLDGRVIHFYESNKATARTLRDIIRSKQRFPKDEFAKLKEAFPCILAGIRDYAEYIPLEPEIFDLVIIDEASQVSIAQAFPALLRAKKVLILGDKKQFSNIKAALARTDTNREYLNGLRDVFGKQVSEEAVKLKRLDKFNIKTSILEFFEFISNYDTQLLKHFRGYKEIISYSDKFFYRNLQVMKIRGKPIDEVLKFSYVEPDGRLERIPNTNPLEAEFIISELNKLRESRSIQSVGIITPHTNQQKLLVERISGLPNKDYFFDKLKLKIMTFDTCQGEERDIIFYSIVATKEADRLWGVFIKDLASVDLEEDGQIKAQRLNVGFSRAKECMHFVLSKPIDAYGGSIGEALRHYAYTLEEAKKEKSPAAVDPHSPMEPEVLNWFYQTKFWGNNKQHIDFLPQFEIGKYLKQLDRNYFHPEYKVDFLLVYTDAHQDQHKIIIEYDGFKEHFKDMEKVNAYNYQEYYSEEDVYREKVLESYGYKFLRINRFNAGSNPIAALDERIAGLIKNGETGNQILKTIHHTVSGLQNGQMKECPKCGEVRTLEDFKDAALIRGYGRFCKYCKGLKSTPTRAAHATQQDENFASLSQKVCPQCGSRMMLRSGRYGKFYGCSRYPYCRRTQPYS